MMHDRFRFPRWFATLSCLAAITIAAFGATARAQDRAQGEIRLWAPISSVPSSAAVSPDGRFVLVSTADGNVSAFDVNSRYAQNEVLISAPIRDEEFQRQRPLAIAPDGDLVAMGAPLARDVPNSARVYFFKRSNNKLILYTIDKLPSRPLELRFSADRGGTRLLLVVLLANKQSARVYDVSKVREAADNSTIEPDAAELVLPEPFAGFAGACERRECNASGIAFAPDNDANIRLIIGSDSGLVLYDRNFVVAAYGFWKDGRPDLRRVSSISFSPNGKQLAISRRPLEKEKNDENHSCQVDIYDFDALTTIGPDRRLTATPSKTLYPPPYKGQEVCFFSHVEWTSDAIFAVGNFVAEPEPGQSCKTFRDLEPDYDPYANLMVRWGTRTFESSTHCLGTNTAADLKSFAIGGVVTVTQDPSLIVFNSDGGVSRYPAQANLLRQFDGPVFDFRDASRGDMTVSADGNIVYLRPLAAPRPYVAFDASSPPTMSPLVSEMTKQGMLKELQEHRADPIEYAVPTRKSPGVCLGVAFPDAREPITMFTTEPLTVQLRDVLKFAPTETVRSYQYLEPGQAGQNWRVVIGTSHRLLYADCKGADLWNGKDIAEVAFAGIPIRNDAYQLVVSGDQRFLVVAHADGVLRWYRMSSGQNVLSAYLHPDLRSWVAWTPEGFFDRSNTSGSRRAGWFQSAPDGNGKWTAQFQGLSRYEAEWRKPKELSKALSQEKYDSSLSVPVGIPDTGKPDINFQVLNGNSTTDPNIRARVQVGTFDEKKPLLVGIEGYNTISIKQTRSKQDRGMQIDISFTLDACLQTTGKSWRIWVQYDGSREYKHLVYDGSNSDVRECAPRKVWGIVVGVSKYDKTPQLQYAHQDAERFFDFWKNQQFYQIGRISMLVAPPTGSAQKTILEGGKAAQTTPYPDAGYRSIDDFIRSELTEITRETVGIRKDDILVVYFAGHGISDPEHWYFMPSDGDAKDPRKTAFNLDQLKGALTFFRFNPNIPVLVFVDACRSFDAFGPERYSIQNTAQGDIQELTRAFYATVFLATGKGKAAYELPEQNLKKPTDPSACAPDGGGPYPTGGGAFTHVLLNVLNGKGADPNGYIPMYEVDRYLKTDVKSICAKQDYQKIDGIELPGFFGTG